jgi:hypothetical protein
VPACGGGDFTATSGSGGSLGGADAATDGASSGGTSGDGARSGSGGSGGGNSSGGEGSGGRQAGDGGSSAGGNQSTGGSAGIDAGNGGSTLDAGAGGAAEAGPSSGGTMNSGGMNGGGGGCPDPTTWYFDSDQDGYGSTSAPTVQSCNQPQGHYTKVGGDCDDEKRDVHPQLTLQEKKFFGTPYKTTAGAESYDYDCSGAEKGDPGQQTASTCTFLMIGGGSCGGSGYSPGSNRGAGFNAYCGSLKFQSCKSVAGVSCSTTNGSVTTPYGCN